MDEIHVGEVWRLELNDKRVDGRWGFRMRTRAVTCLSHRTKKGNTTKGMSKL